MSRRLTGIVDLVDPCSLIDQRSGCLQITFDAGKVQWRFSTLILSGQTTLWGGVKSNTTGWSFITTYSIRIMNNLINNNNYKKIEKKVGMEYQKAYKQG